MNKIITKTGETAYFLAVILTTLGVALMTKASLGLSMIVAPAYILSQRVSPLSFGMAEYVVQAFLLLVLFCSVRRIQWRYFLTFASALLYGGVLDLMIMLTNAGSVPESTAARAALYIAGLLLSDMGVSLYFNSYFPPCCYDMFVRELAGNFGIKQTKVKIAYDVSSFAFAVVLSLVFFGELRGIGVGTVFCVAVNGLLIGFYNKLFLKLTDFSPALPGLHRLISTGA